MKNPDEKVAGNSNPHNHERPPGIKAVDRLMLCGAREGVSFEIILNCGVLLAQPGTGADPAVFNELLRGAHDLETEAAAYAEWLVDRDGVGAVDLLGGISYRLVDGDETLYARFRVRNVPLETAARIQAGRLRAGLAPSLTPRQADAMADVLDALAQRSRQPYAGGAR